MARTKSVFRILIESGIQETDRPQKKRAILLSNYTSFILSTASLLLFVIIPQNHNLSGFLEFVVGMLIFGAPILLNAWSFTNLSRLYLCWLPPALIIWYMSTGMENATTVSVSSYNGIRYYLLAFSCIPYLLFERKNLPLLLIGILPGLISILFCDTILDWLDVGYSQKGTADAGYAFTNVRTFVSYVILNSICLALKSVIDNSDKLNEKLLAEIEQKNLLLQKQSAEKLRQSERDYRSLFEQASDAIFIVDMPNGKIADCNLTACKLFGYSWPEMVELNMSDLMDSEQLKTYPMRADLGEGEHFVSERIFRTKSRKSIDVEASVKRIDGNRILSIVRDITERKKIEQELREAEEKFRNLVERSLVGVYIIADGKFAYVNPTVEEFFGYRTQELENSTVEMIVHPDDQAMVAENLRQRLRGEKDSIRYELRGVKKDKSVVWLEAFGTRTQYMGNPAVIGTIIDITERKKLEEQQSFLASLVHSSEEAIISNTPDGRITSWNRGAEKLFGYSAAEALGHSIRMLIPPDRVIEDERIQHQVDSGFAVDHFETRRLKKDGELIFISLTVSPIRNVAGTIIGASRIARDITARRQAEVEKDKARYLLNERIKELRTLYSTGQILQAEEKPVTEILQEIVAILPPGWQYPKITAARIKLGKREFKTENFRPTPWSQLATFVAPGGQAGIIEVVYLEEKPTEVEGPFLSEERDLIAMLAEMIRSYLARKSEKEALKKSEASLNATINNTTFFVWSINDKFELQNINQPFRRYIKEQFNIDVLVGLPVNLLHTQGVLVEVFEEKWNQNYERALSGESFELEEVHGGKSFKFSLNPIIDHQAITGATIFSEDTTEFKRKERELQAANRQIGDLKLMALRAAMNPHFIFNTLNSIQYYIMENDQRNAVNYLSTFSKLIRGILSNSVNTRIKLVDEFQMLRHYVQLEQMRFENKFEFELYVDNDLDVENIEIPSMLIQPYVENAILHGLTTKYGAGKLKISAREAAGGILFEIEDDGIGRKAAREVQDKNTSKHKSFGTTLTEERLKLINSQRNVSFEIIDLEEGGQAAGTRVKIWVSE